MAIPVAEFEPVSFFVGDTVTWRKSLSDYPADQSWALSYFFQGPGFFSTAAAASGASHLVTIAAATTLGQVPGRYRLIGITTKASERATVYDGECLLGRNFAEDLAGFDTRSHARKCLEAIEAVLEGRASRSDLTYSIAGRQVGHYTLKELIEARDYWASKVLEEERQALIDAGQGPKHHIAVRFNNWRGN